MKKIMKSIMVCMLLALTLSVSGKGNLLQVLAAGDSMYNATGMSIGVNYSGSIGNSHNKEFYCFEIPSSGRVKLSATAAMREIYYRIYDSEGNLVYSIDSSWDSTTQLISTNSYADLVKGTYYFVVEKINNWADCYSGNYSIKLNFTSANESFTETSSENDNTLFNANSISVNAKYDGQIADNDEKDFYRFTLPSSGRIDLIATAEMREINYHIYDSEGNSLFFIRPWWNSTTQLISTDDYIDLTKGTYYFVVEKVGVYTGNYSFKLNFTSANESFTETGSGNDNLLSSANSIVLNKQYYGQLADNDEKDFYKFTLKSAAQVSLKVMAGMRYISYSIYNKSGNRLDGGWAYWNDTSKKIDISKEIQLTAGTYYIVFERYNGRTGPYNFKLKTSSDSTAKKKTPTIKVSKKTAVYQATKVKRSSQSFKIGAKVTGNGKITYKKLSGSSKLTVGRDGKVTIRKGTKKGTYKAVVQIKAATSSQYKAKTTKITVVVKVK